MNQSNNNTASQPTQDRTELHRALWAMANDLRGSVDGWDFKQYVLGMIFYRYLSEFITLKLNQGEHEAGNVGFDFAQLKTDIPEPIRQACIQMFGFYLDPKHLFQNVLALGKGHLEDNINLLLHEAFDTINKSAASNPKAKKAIGKLFEDFDTNGKRLGSTQKECNQRLYALMQSVASMKLSSDLKDHQIDAFGDAYEYLMGMYASSAGKSGGEFFTPQEVSRLLARITILDGRMIDRVYDPACGSGSLLLQVARLLHNNQLEYYGQEINRTTYNLCRMNMFLHQVAFNQYHIELGDTLMNPSSFENEKGEKLDIKFDAIVSNPPYSIKWSGHDKKEDDPRFSPAGVLAPKSKADLAFVMHSYYYLAEGATAAIVCFPGVMYRGGAEQKIRQYLLQNNAIDAVIQLPENLFYGTSITTCILVMKKGRKNEDIVFVDASREFIKVTNNNHLTAENIDTILGWLKAREAVDHRVAVVPRQAVLDNEANLSVSSYVTPEDTREKIDIKVLNAQIAELAERQAQLRADIDRLIAEIDAE